LSLFYILEGKNMCEILTESNVFKENVLVIILR
jgi:hypothetical protein